MSITTARPQGREQTRAAVADAADVLRSGGLVVFPTETVYGVAALADSDAGVAALRALKAGGRPEAFTAHLPDREDARRLIDEPGLTLRQLMRKAFPGAVTAVVEVPEQTIGQRIAALGWAPQARDRVYRQGYVGLRCPDHPLARELLRAVDGVVVAASAGREAVDAEKAVDAAAGRVDYVLDGGRCRFGKPSTVVRFSGRGANQSAVIERVGVYEPRSIRKLMRWNLLLVCSGNTCRSPMAEGIARQLIAEQLGVKADELDAQGVAVSSAGAYAQPGSPPSPEAVAAVADMGADISNHRSSTLTPERVQAADAIYTMTDAHRQAVLDLMPGAAAKTQRLDPGADIEDPIGAGSAVYRRTAEAIRRHLTQRLQEQLA